jgi:Spy/CpxP family protein refolding chaperone
MTDIFSGGHTQSKHFFQNPVYSSRKRRLGRHKEHHKMKRILLSTSLALALSGSLAFAQSTTTTTPAPEGKHFHHHAHNPQQEAAWIGKKLNLSSDQTAKLEPIFADSQQKVTALRANTSLSQDQRREQFRAIHKDTQTQLATVLTPEQIEQLHSMRHAHGQHQPLQQPQSATPPPAS